MEKEGVSQFCSTLRQHFFKVCFMFFVQLSPGENSSKEDSLGCFVSLKLLYSVSDNLQFFHIFFIYY